VTIAGNVDVLELTVSGVGSFKGEALISKQATVRNSGVGHVVVNVSEQLNATASGVGAIEYIGSPQVQKSVEGVGSINQR
jgi:anti-anti-sigma regulatory factor